MMKLTLVLLGSNLAFNIMFSFSFLNTLYSEVLFTTKVIMCFFDKKFGKEKNRFNKLVLDF